MEIWNNLSPFEQAVYLGFLFINMCLITEILLLVSLSRKNAR